MKQYNFDEIIDRDNTNCEKYDSRERIFGRKDVIPLWVADTDFRTPDFIVEAVKARAAHEIYGYPIVPGSFYFSIQNWIKTHHNWNIDTEWIEYCPNVVIGLASAVLSLTQPGDEIVVQTPVYFPFFHVTKGNDRIMVENPLALQNGRYYFDIEDLKSKISPKTRMLILCNPHNPGSMVWKPEELTELGNICLENNIIVVSDEIHSDIIYPGFKHTPFASLSEEFAQNCITAMSASKTFNIAGLSSAYLIIKNNVLRKKFQKFMGSTHISSGNFFGQVATEAAYTHGHDWLKQLMDYIEGNYQFLEKFLSEKLPKIKPMRPEGTYLVWIDFRGLELRDEKVYKLLIKAGVGLSPGHLFGIPHGKGFMRLNLGCPRSILHQALVQIENEFSALAK